MHLSASVAGWIAIAAATAAGVALLLALGYWVALRRVRSAQRVVIGDGTSDLIDFAVSLQSRIDELHKAVDEVGAGVTRVDRRIDDTVSKTAIVRYDPYENTARPQSAPLPRLHPPPTPALLT